MKKNHLINNAGIVLMIVSVICLMRRIISMNVNFRDLLTPVNAAMLASMPFLTVIVVFSNSYCWRMNLQLFSKEHIPVGNAFHVYARANIMKYLPGNVGHYAGRQLFGAKLGIRQAELAAASILEIFYNALAIILSALLLSAQIVLNELYKWFTSKVLLGFGVGLCIALISAGVSAYIFRKNKYMAIAWRLVHSIDFWRCFIVSVFLFAFSSLLVVMEYVVLLNQYTVLDFYFMSVVLAANLTAVFIGFITPGVPGGLGVREAVLVGILSPFFSEDIVILAAAVHRMIMVLGDLAAVPVSRLFVEDY